MTELDLNRAVLLYCEVQLSAKDLAARFGVSPNTLLRRLRARRVPIRDKTSQRYSDKVFGRYDHGKRIQTAFAAGRYDTDAYRTRRGGFLSGVDRAGERNPFFGRTHSALTRVRLSHIAKARAIPGTGSYGPEWTRELRDAVLDRDGHRCRRCGREECMLQIHHVDTGPITIQAISSRSVRPAIWRFMAAKKASKRFVLPPLELLSGRKCAKQRARRKEVFFPMALNQLGL